MTQNTHQHTIIHITLSHVWIQIIEIANRLMRYMPVTLHIFCFSTNFHPRASRFVKTPRRHILSLAVVHVGLHNQLSKTKHATSG